MRTSNAMRSMIGALCALQTVAAVPVAAAVPRNDRPTAIAMDARDLARTVGGLEARLTNLPATGGVLLSLPAGNKVDLELTTHLPDALSGYFTVTATANGVPLPVTFVSLANVGPVTGRTGTTVYYSIDVGPACALGAVILDIKGTLVNTFSAQSSRWVLCS